MLELLLLVPQQTQMNRVCQKTYKANLVVVYTYEYGAPCSSLPTIVQKH
jgi:hypothetical protein